jgi:isoleucyl-tRNA synthetase
MADEMYLNLSQNLFSRKDSVHLEDYPKYHHEWKDGELEQRMSIVREAVTLGRSLRNDNKVKTRQPLRELKIIASKIEDVSEMSSIIAEELNVKKVSFLENEAGLVKRKLKPNFRALGVKFGPRMKEFQAEITNLSADKIDSFITTGKITLAGEEVSGEELVVEESAGEGLAFRRGTSMAIILDLNLTKELKLEGHAREFVNKVQNLRKDKDYHITDRIAISFYTGSAEIKEAFDLNRDHILNEVLGIRSEFINPDDVHYSEFVKDSVELNINGFPVRIKTTLDK